MLRGRIVIPVHNPSSRLLAYASRAIDGAEPKHQFPASFHKSLVLFNLHRASGALCDSVRIQQVVWNLVSNAVKFTPKGGQVHVTLSREESSFQMQVSDTGQGISSELLPHVFDRFRQADSSTRRKVAGLGLGLSIVKSIVEAHGGTVEATSPGEGKGSTFTVRLPVHAVRIREEREEEETEGESGEDEPADSVHVADRPPPVRLDGVHVLVVDDEADSSSSKGNGSLTAVARILPVLA